MVTLADMAEACWEVLDEAARGEPAIVVGESVGWHIVMHMANQRPNQTLAIIMSGCAYRTADANARPHARQDMGQAFSEQGMSVASAAR